jgi:phosphoribosylformylglycinamidine cyclo-ligase
MYQVFNMGHRFEIYTDEKSALDIISIAGEFNLEAKVIGHCEASDSRKLTIKSEYGIFEY